MLTLLFAVTVGLCSASSTINIGTYTDNQCITASTISPNVSIPLDACITTIGMESFHYAATPCAGGGATSVQQYGYSDPHCVNSWSLDYGSYGNHCYGAWLSGNAFGSIMLTCKAEDSNPEPVGTSVTISVGAVATDSSSGTSTAASGSSPTTSTPATSTTSLSPTSNGSSSGWSSLSLGERIGIIVAIAVGIPPILIGLWMLRIEIKKRAAGRDEESDAARHRWPQSSTELATVQSRSLHSPSNTYATQSPYHYASHYVEPWNGGRYQ